MKFNRALLEKLYDFWVAATGRPPGFSRPADGGNVSGPFVRFTQKLAAETLEDLERERPLKERNALRRSLSELAVRSDKVAERLKAVRRFWVLPSSNWEDPPVMPASDPAETEKK